VRLEVEIEMNNKTILTTIVLSLLMISLVSASTKVTTVPNGMTVEQFKQIIADANSGNFLQQATVSSTWKSCERDCSAQALQGDCNPCGSGQTQSSCFVCGDSQSCASWSSGSGYCNDWTKQYTYYNKQCYCTTPSVQCSGGYNSGETKCQGSNVMTCSNDGIWQLTQSCTYGCENSQCKSQTCQSHDHSECSGNNVYWFNSCGQQEQLAEECAYNEKCSNGECTKNCDVGYIGSKSCVGLEIKQQYQTADCSTELRTVQVCDTTTQTCQDGNCNAKQCSCNEPSTWSSCSSNKMTRTNYRCGASSTCEAYTEEQACTCTTDAQCQNDEKCSSSACVALNCDSATQSVGVHTCVDKGSDYNWFAIIITGILVLCIVGAFGFVVIKYGLKRK
jgi:hypothetical protein